ncbi:ROK family transcriptional regulator [Kribbella italica]|uniref:Putative NBD/HSP70 family sugar kinase n=1 Tax=Kribbella italica TaxID=1540520 RepID=A0A7W9MU34_9ACTN|nr:ROK family transcriptional regulator [Kribbella italica]MBB5835770.1 putative NBD/HSP70 family sugar kinase [Kribbella italica]
MNTRVPTMSADHTRSVILDHIRAAGRVSRVELARLSGLTPAAISMIVRKIMSDGLVLEAGTGEATGGKRRTLLAINSASRYAVGVCLDYERLTFVVTDLSGHLVGRLTVDGPRDTEPEDVLRTIGRQVTKLVRDLQVDPARVVGLGVASPGPLDSRQGILLGSQPTSAWTGLRLRDRLEALSGLPVLIDNDATCAALGEHWTSRRAADEKAVTATVYMADGIGCGILTDGRVFHGMSSNAGEIGHTSLDLNGPLCRCGGRGCVELYAGPAAVVGAARRLPELVSELQLDQADGRNDFRRIVKAAARGHDQCRQLLEKAASHLAVAVVTLTNILDLDEVHLSGPGFTDAGAIYARVIQDGLDQTSFLRSIHPTQVKISHLGTEAAALGAAALVLQHHITPHSVRPTPLDRTENAVAS